jgi:hypothetical protein
VLANDRDVEGVAIFDEQAAGAIEDDAARGPQGQRPLVVVLRHLLELAELHHLEEPETTGQQTESNSNRHPQDVEA